MQDTEDDEAACPAAEEQAEGVGSAGGDSNAGGVRLHGKGRRSGRSGSPALPFNRGAKPGIQCRTTFGIICNFLICRQLYNNTAKVGTLPLHQATLDWIA